MSTARYVVVSFEPDEELALHDLVDVPIPTPDGHEPSAYAMGEAQRRRIEQGYQTLSVAAWQVDRLRTKCDEWARAQPDRVLSRPAETTPSPEPAPVEGRRFFKTTFTYEVLAEGEPFRLGRLEDLAHKCGDGPCSGLQRDSTVEEVPLPEFSRLCDEHGTALEFFLPTDALAEVVGVASGPSCQSRYDPEGRHEEGYRCTLPGGHEGDHQAASLAPSQPVMGWGAVEGLAAQDPGRAR